MATTEQRGRGARQGRLPLLALLLAILVASAGGAPVGRAQTGGHEGSVRGVAFSPDGRLLASASSDRTIKLWEVATGAEVATLRGHTAQVQTVAFLPDGRLLASAGNDGVVRFWSLGD